MLRGWLGRGLSPLIAVDPHPSARLLRLKGVEFVPDIGTIAACRPRVCVVALKPQVLRSQAIGLRPIAAGGTTMVSIAAGTSIATLRKSWGKQAKILRAMPNTPGAIGKGISAIYAPANIAAGERRLVARLLAPLGETIWVGRESLIDVTTAVSGSGPAYVFLMVEALAEAAQAQGMPRAEADKLARATIMGAGALLASDKRSPAELRRDVTSPGGTTEAALEVLAGKNGLNSLIARAVAAANKRAGELSS
jgi:pyrroline-5-carboxylate reductase